VGLTKLQAALPELIGRTISQIMVCVYEERFELHFFFTDGMAYEFYTAIPAITGARQISRDTLETVRDPNYIPANGKLVVLDRTTAIITMPPNAK
jgi:hypothetical protein